MVPEADLAVVLEAVGMPEVAETEVAESEREVRKIGLRDRKEPDSTELGSGTSSANGLRKGLDRAGGLKGLLDLRVRSLVLPLLGGPRAVIVWSPVGCPTANGFMIGVMMGNTGKEDAVRGCAGVVLVGSSGASSAKTPSSGEFGGFGGERARRIENPRKGLSEREVDI